MHGCCLDFVKRKEARHTAERERESGRKRRIAARGVEKKSRRGKEEE